MRNQTTPNPTSPMPNKISQIALFVLCLALTVATGCSNKTKSGTDSELPGFYHQAFEENAEIVIAKFLEKDATAISQMRIAAEHGNAFAQRFLGSAYAYGDIIEKDTKLAIYWLQKATEQNEPFAPRMLAYLYFNGDSEQGIDVNYTEAEKWLCRAIEQDTIDLEHVDIIVSLGLAYYSGGPNLNLEKAAKWFHKGAEIGYAPCQAMIGHCYQLGYGVQEDKQKAVEWLNKAAEQNDIGAQCSLGRCYLHGDGIQKDEVKAVEWLNKAAEQNNVEAQYLLGQCYLRGLGITQNRSEGIVWLRKAAEHTYTPVTHPLSYYVHLSQFLISECYRLGKGVEKNEEEAKKWFEKVENCDNPIFATLRAKDWIQAKEGVAEAQTRFGLQYFYGDPVLEDKAEAAKWLLLAAEQGDAYAQRFLGFMYAEGEGVPTNIAESQKWLQKAKEQNFDEKTFEMLKSMPRHFAY